MTDTFDRIKKALDEGGTLCVSNHYHAWIITHDMWLASLKRGIPAIKLSGRSIYVALGKRYHCIDYCRLTLTKPAAN